MGIKGCDVDIDSLVLLVNMTHSRGKQCPAKAFAHDRETEGKATPSPYTYTSNSQPSSSAEFMLTPVKRGCQTNISAYFSPGITTKAMCILKL